MSEVLTTMLSQYMAIAEEVCDQAYHMQRALKSEGRARILKCRLGVLPYDSTAEIVILAEPYLYSIVSLSKDEKSMLLQCEYIDGVTKIIGGEFEDLFVD